MRIGRPFFANTASFLFVSTISALYYFVNCGLAGIKSLKQRNLQIGTYKIQDR